MGRRGRGAAGRLRPCLSLARTLRRSRALRCVAVWHSGEPVPHGWRARHSAGSPVRARSRRARDRAVGGTGRARSEEHTSELPSQPNLVCRLLLEKKKKLLRSYRKRTRLKSSHSQIAYAVLCLKTKK